ncbi:DUF6951 family protein [Methanosarcina sp. UBA289]|mgnify:FL=1|uniref:DUF6951 family protein n=1 Tax=Methanosarcina sp. UBA289 TaxID=1915574 RepID=UPI0025F18FC6|nr:hypothetical protein [Methanosarcina sp. UBA289]
MATEISLNTICGHTTKIIATKEGKTTHIHIKTTCEKLSKWGTHFDVEMKDLMGGPESVLDQKMTEAPLTPTCLVPAAVMNACWLENGMISKNLARGMGKMEIIFDKLE